MRTLSRKRHSTSRFRKMDPHAAHGTEHGHQHHELSFIRRYIFSEDHKIIGIQFLFTSLIMFMVGGFLALMVRIQLAWPAADIPILGPWLWPGHAGHIMPP